MRLELLYSLEEVILSYRGHIKDGAVILDEPVALPDGTEVEIEPTQRCRETLADRFRAIIGIVTDLPEDMAENHDHYIHGTPKK